jgi:hypothetical protein
MYCCSPCRGGELTNLSVVWLGFTTGIPRVGFFNTPPEPVNTIPVQPQVWYLQVAGKVLLWYRGVPMVYYYYLIKKQETKKNGWGEGAHISPAAAAGATAV